MQTPLSTETPCSVRQKAMMDVYVCIAKMMVRRKLWGKHSWSTIRAVYIHSDVQSKDDGTEGRCNEISKTS